MTYWRPMPLLAPVITKVCPLYMLRLLTNRRRLIGWASRCAIVTPKAVRCRESVHRWIEVRWADGGSW